MRPAPEVAPNTWAFLRDPMISPRGFREYDVRWRYPEEINLPGLSALGLGLGTQMHARGVAPRIVVGHDYRAYSLEVAQALTLGLIRAGIQVQDIGPALSPMAYFARVHLDAPAVAMVTASHNPDGWTGVKIGFASPLTHGPDEMAELRDIVMGGQGIARGGGGWARVDGMLDAYLDDLMAAVPPLVRPLRVVCATGNGTASAVAPRLLRRLGAEVVPLHAALDYTFPHYDPNPESMEMLQDIGRAVRESGADLGLGFDGDGDRCGVVDATGREVFADVMGVILARDLAARHPGARFLADVKSTGLFATDPVLRDRGAATEYWRTGHSHMKARLHETGALAGFEKSGHYFFGPPLGRGYDCGMRAAVEICRLLDRHPSRGLAELRAELPPVWNTPTLSPACADEEKYAVVARLTARLEAIAGTGRLGGRRIERVVTVNGARAQLEGGGWALVRASSNTPNLVVVCESATSEAELRAILADLDALLRADPAVGAYDQTF